MPIDSIDALVLSKCHLQQRGINTFFKFILFINAYYTYLEVPPAK